MTEEVGSAWESLSKGKACPLLKTACLKKQCAWYEASETKCAVVLIAMFLDPNTALARKLELYK